MTSENKGEEDLKQLQLIEEGVNNLLLQKQQFQSQLLEVESALSELGKTEDAYRIVGNIMVHSKKGDLDKDLKEKKKMLDLRIKNLEKQEETMKEKAKKLQTRIMSRMSEK